MYELHSWTLFYVTFTSILERRYWSLIIEKKKLRLREKGWEQDHNANTWESRNNIILLLICVFFELAPRISYHFFVFFIVKCALNYFHIYHHEKNVRDVNLWNLLLLKQYWSSCLYILPIEYRLFSIGYLIIYDAALSIMPPENTTVFQGLSLIDGNHKCKSYLGYAGNRHDNF